ncbi:uncharacterized protein E0L32_002400 [Thyridium curvatum]|uniref:HhH-GPD domain-containing protein n=1 Tax=Thyridium curvatum TaxID=1093900 RepID=A0A507ALC2_9PEZI|nr:uncharacterized protein E0L32_002400 [Thyridium curvatum]TPX06904.1 hypothetical protein E0L32_002400 [Thyridium curvatum]
MTSSAHGVVLLPSIYRVSTPTSLDLFEDRGGLMFKPHSFAQVKSICAGLKRLQASQPGRHPATGLLPGRTTPGLPNPIEAIAAATRVASTMAPRRSARLSMSATANGETAQSEAMPPPPRAAPQPRKRKAARQADAPDGSAATAAPTTPRKRRAQAPAARPSTPPATPTPSAAGLFAEPANGLTPKPKHAALNRLADPERTNAPLLSPETSRIVSTKPVDLMSPSKKSAATTTTATLLEEACAHLIKTDARMKPLIDAHHCRVFSPEGLAEKIDPFESLCSGIISQQVSGAAAKAIKARFVALFDDDADADSEPAAPTTGGQDPPKKKRFPHPSQVAATAIERLRTAGLSQRKAEYVQGLAEKFAAGELSARLLADAPYDEVLERLIAVRGLGRWSVEMFACFALKRMDVFSLGDLGVQRGMAAFAGRDVAKLKAKGGGKWKYMSERDMEEMAEPFRPYRSLFMWYMWRVEETDISTLE